MAAVLRPGKTPAGLEGAGPSASPALHAARRETIGEPPNVGLTRRWGRLDSCPCPS